MALVDLVKILSTTTGTGAITFGSAVSGYRGVEALIDGNVYSYSIQQDADWELGRGTYLATGKTFVRSPLFSSVGGGQINLQQNAAVSLVVLAEDLYDLAGVGTVDTRALAAEIARATGVEAYLSNRIVAASLGIVHYDTVALMNADLSKPVGTFAIVDEDDTIYRYTTPDGWIEDTAFGQALAAFVQPLVDQVQAAVDAQNLGRRLPTLTTPGASYYGVYSTERLVDSVGPLIEMTDGAGGPPGAYGMKEEGVSPLSALVARGGSEVARVTRVFDQLGSTRSLAQPDTTKQPAAMESVTTNGVLGMLMHGRRRGIGLEEQRGLAMTNWSLPARNNTRILVIEPTVSIARQLYERWANSNAGTSDRNLFTASSDDGQLPPEAGGKLQYNLRAEGHLPVSPVVLTVREGDISTDIWFNDVRVPYGEVGQDGTLSSGFLGYGTEDLLAPYNVCARYLAYGATTGALNDADILAIYKQLAARFDLDAENAPRVVISGDSIGEGTRATYTRNLIYYLRRLLVKRCRIYNLALSGNTQQWSYDNRVALEGALYQPDRRCVAIIQGGINDIHAQGRTGAALYNDTTKPYIAYLKTTGYRVIVNTLLPQAANNVEFAEPQRLAYNALVRANSGGADAVNDIAANAVMGAYPGAPNDPTLYPDKIHPTSRGYGYIAPDYAAIVNAQLA